MENKIDKQKRAAQITKEASEAMNREMKRKYPPEDKITSYYFKIIAFLFLWIFVGYFWGSRSFSLGYFIWIILGLIIFTSLLFVKTVKSLTLKKVYIISFSFISILIFGLTFYVNYFMPHGPKYNTGDVACQNDYRGPCGEQYKEDMRFLNIPEWAKTIRENGVWIGIVFAVIAGYVYYFDKNYEEE